MQLGTYLRASQLSNFRRIKNSYQYRRFGFAWLAAAVLAAPMVVFIVCMIVMRIHQYQAHDRLEEQQLVRLVIPESQFRWHKKGKEILVDNRHFDCKEVKKQGDRYYVTGIFDSEEDLLEEKLEKATRQSPKSSWLKGDAMFLVFFSNVQSLQIERPEVTIGKKSRQLFVNDYTSIYTEPLSPPPNYYS